MTKINHFIETTEEHNEDMLEVLPPIYISIIDGVKVSDAFAVSEPVSFCVDPEKKGLKQSVPTFNICYRIEDKFYSCQGWLENITHENYNLKEFTRGHIAHTVEPYKR